ncbi:MAG TPA: DUF4097 family beta strand repeat-containing protein [Jatrophihabitantaceae bacterium]|nr:DUF4097 family beta strand repeat-containing protein [Jatrophihabitantaceae bacterium]
MSDEGVTTSARPEVRVATGSGSVRVVGEARDGVAADGGLVKVDGASVNVVAKKNSGSLVIRVPEGTDLVVGTRSGSLEVRGRVGSVRYTTMSGSLLAEHVTSADVRTMSGSIEVEACDGLCRVKTKSGSTRVGSAGEVEVTIGSGSIEVQHVTGSARARAISGSVGIGAQGDGRIEAETMSGSITITLPEGVHPNVRAKSLSRSTDIDVPSGDDCEIYCKTLSGGIKVRARR